MTPLAAPREGDAADGLPGFAHHYAEVNGTRLHYVSGGQGPAVVLLHGWPYTWAEWRKLMPLLADSGLTVIAPDLRGLGHSERADSGYEKSSVAEDVRQVVRLLGFASIDLVGTDIGTFVAFAYAQRHPGEVRRLVLAESLIPGFGLEELMNPATGGYWHFGFHMQVDLATMLTKEREEAYLLPFMTMMSASPDAADTAKTLFLPHYMASGGMRAGFQHYGTLLADGAENRAAFRSKLPMPVLVLNGEHGLPQAQLLACVHQIANTIETALVPGSAHTFANDNPAWVSERLIRFLQHDAG